MPRTINILLFLLAALASASTVGLIIAALALAGFWALVDMGVVWL
jgi:hypothetical protein